MVASMAAASAAAGGAGRLAVEDPEEQPGSASQPSPVHVTAAGKHFDCAHCVQLEDVGSRQSQIHFDLEHEPSAVQHEAQELLKPSFSTHESMHESPLTRHWTPQLWISDWREDQRDRITLTSLEPEQSAVAAPTRRAAQNTEVTEGIAHQCSTINCG